MLKLYASKKREAGVEWNTDFCTTPTEITESNQYDFFRYDHTAILFQDGKRTKKNFVHATAIIIDIDNKCIDDPERWVTPAILSQRLGALGITHAVATSRNHELEKSGESPRPRFHVYFPLSEPCNQEMYEKMTEYAIKTFGGDPATKDAARQFFGYGFNQHPVVYQQAGTCMFDEFYEKRSQETEDRRQKKQDILTPDSLLLTPLRHPAADFNENGRTFIKKILESHGWKYMRQDSVNEYWQRPGKDCSKDHSATIKLDAPLFYIFSSNCQPFHEWKAYNFFQIYALLAHAGNESAATKDLARQGFGDPLLLQHVELPKFITEMPDEESDTITFAPLPSLGRWDTIGIENYDEIEQYDIDDPGLIPDDLLHPPGLIGEIAQYTFDTNNVPQQEFALATGIAMTAHLIGKLYRTPDNLRSNIYIMSLGESGAGKDKAIDFIMDKQIQSIDQTIGGTFTGHVALINYLREAGKTLICWDELGVKLEAILNRGNIIVSQLLGCLTELYSAANRTFYPERKAADKGVRAITEPHCCLYGTGTYKSVFKAFTPTMIENGFIGRLLFFFADPKSESKNQYDESIIPDSILSQIKEWIKMSCSIPEQNQFSVFPEAKIVPYTDDAKQIFTQFSEHCKKAKIETDERLMCLWARSVQEAKKLALIYACSASREAPSIDETAASWACRLSEHLTLRKLYIANCHMAADEQGHLENDIVCFVKKNKSVTQTKLIDRFKHGVPKRLRDEAIKNLLETGRLIREKMTVGKSQKPSTIFRTPCQKRK